MDSGRGRRTAVWLALLALLAAAQWLRAGDPGRANHDVAWTLQAGAILLDGGAYGVDVIDNNPPFVYWLCAGIVALSRALGIAPLLGYALFTWLAAALAAGLTRRLLDGGVLPPPWADAAVWSLLAVWLLAPGADTGQRDHLSFLLAAPYLVATGRRAAGLRDGRVPSGLPGALAALGFALKPYYALCWLGAELWVLARRWRARDLLVADNAALALLGCTGLALLLALTPDYLERLGEIRRLHGAYDRPVDWLSPAHLLCLLAAAALPWLRGPAALLGVVQTLVVAAWLALGIFHLQAKGWAYHGLPALLAGASALLLAGAGALSQRPALSARFPRAAGGGLALGAAALAALGLTRPLPEQVGVGVLARFLEEESAGGEVMVFSAALNPFYPAIAFTSSRAALPYSCLWLIAGHYSAAERAAPLFPYRSLSEMSESERRFVTTVVDALERRRPRLLLYDPAPVRTRLFASPLDYHRYFGADPRYAGLLSGYRRLGVRRFSAGGWRRYEVWLREAAPASARATPG
jgi:hypothetical protein